MDLEDALSLPGDFSGIVRLFPLPNFVLFPGAIQPFHIFEDRYRDLLEDALHGDQLIAMATLQPGWEPNYDGRPPLVATACLGRVVSHTRLEDGRFNILLLGMHRIGIINELPEDRTFRSADVELLPDRYPQESSSTRPTMRRRFTETVSRYVSQAASDQQKFENLISSDLSLGLMTDIFTSTIDFDLEFKQELLAEQNVDRRCQLLLDRLVELESSSNANPLSFQFPIKFSDN